MVPREIHIVWCILLVHSSSLDRRIKCPSICYLCYQLLNLVKNYKVVLLHVTSWSCYWMVQLWSNYEHWKIKEWTKWKRFFFFFMRYLLQIFRIRIRKYLDFKFLLIRLSWLRLKERLVYHAFMWEKIAPLMVGSKLKFSFYFINCVIFNIWLMNNRLILNFSNLDLILSYMIRQFYFSRSR